MQRPIKVKPTEKDVLDLIKTKSKLKQDVFELSKRSFSEMKSILRDLALNWEKEISAFDDRLEIAYKDLGEYYAQITIAGDTLLFGLHSNVFFFPNESPYWNSSYLKEDQGRGYCGTISVYNFLADSIRYNREHDLGYMVARLFINSEAHFFVEGKKELGLLFNDFLHSELTSDQMREFLIAVVRHCINFDLFVPDYNLVAQISLADANTMQQSQSYKTGKRLGFQFGMDDDGPKS